MLKDLYSGIVLNKAEKIAKEMSKTKEATAVYAAVFPGKKKSYVFACKACHAGLCNEYETDKIVGSVMLVSSLWTKDGLGSCDCRIGKGARMELGSEKFIALTRKYYSWLINNSIWRDVFIDYRVSSIMDRHAFFIRMDVTDNLMFQACCATRAPWEYSKRLLVWNRMVEGGIDPAIAYIFASQFQEVAADKFSDAEYQYVYSRGCSGHWPMPTMYLDVKKIIQFRKGDTTGIYVGRKKYIKSRTYDGVNVDWSAAINKYRFYNYVEEILCEQGSSKEPVIEIPGFKKCQWSGLKGKFTAQSMVDVVNLVMESIKNDEKQL